MDATLAIVFVVSSLTDMALTDCWDRGCVAAGPAEQRLSFQGAAVEFQNDIIGGEVYLGYDLGTSYGPYQLTAGASVTDTGDTWVGLGAKWRSSDLINTGPWFVETSLMPGIYSHRDGPNIGGALQFRSAFGVGYTFENGGSVTVAYDHRSNADRLDLNPGLETISIRYAISLD